MRQVSPVNPHLKCAFRSFVTDIMQFNKILSPGIPSGQARMETVHYKYLKYKAYSLHEEVEHGQKTCLITTGRLICRHTMFKCFSSSVYSSLDRYRLVDLFR